MVAGWAPCCGYTCRGKRFRGSGAMHLGARCWGVGGAWFWGRGVGVGLWRLVVCVCGVWPFRCAGFGRGVTGVCVCAWYGTATRVVSCGVVLCPPSLAPVPSSRTAAPTAVTTGGGEALEFPSAPGRSGGPVFEKYALRTPPRRPELECQGDAWGTSPAPPHTTRQMMKTTMYCKHKTKIIPKSCPNHPNLILKPYTNHTS